ncbi:MAG: hypothetical protein H2174_10750 [Vampirovibrio sp.]|jgi:hypothetical protein|nr:hypothetical protein [Vampirovibrio sp.]
MMFIPHTPPPIFYIVNHAEVFLEEKVPFIVEQQGSVLMPKGVFTSISKPQLTLINIDGTTNFISGLNPSQSAFSGDRQNNQRGNSTPRPVANIGNVGRQDVHGGGNGRTFSAWG